MKNMTFLKTLLLLTCSTLLLASCDIKGDPGPKGDQGVPGENGKDGISIVSVDLTSSDKNIDTYTIKFSDDSTSTFTITNGVDGSDGVQGNPGKDGTSVLNGSGEPTSNIGIEGDSYIDLLTWDYYLKTDNGWVIQGNLKGTKGETGKSAYELYIEQYPGYTWGQSQWIKDLALGQLSVVVSFETNGGISMDSIIACKGEEININQIPSKDHASFAGWFYDSSCTQQINYSFVAEKDQTFYAKWEYDETTVVFKDKGNIYEVKEVYYYSAVEKTEDDPKADLGYKFAGWKKASDDNLWDFNTPILEDNIVLESSYEYDFLNIPAVIINTTDGTPITSKEEYKSTTVSILNTEEEWTIENVSAGVRGRGNSTWGMEKKPYRIKFDKKQSILGSSYKAKSWTLLANYSDKSLSRNYVAFELSKQFEGLDFTSFHKFVDLYLNNEYKGVYLLCDQIQTGEGRIEIDDSIASDGNNGYFIERDARAKNEGIENQDYFVFNGQEYAIKTPDTEDESYLNNAETEINYIKNYLTECWTAIVSTDENWSEVEELVDVDSFVDQYIIDELFANNDCGFSSCYYYKDKDGKLVKGPVWDYDIGAGNVNYNMGNADECPANTRLWANSANAWYHALLKRSEFVDALKDKLGTYQEKINNTIELANPKNENSLYSIYHDVAERNFERWKIMGHYVWPQPASEYEIDTYYGQMDYLYEWLTTRHKYICEQYDVDYEEDQPESYIGTFNIDSGVEKIIVYETSDYEGSSVESLVGYSRDSATGEYLKDGNGQINFTVVLKPGYTIDTIEVEGTYKNLKLPSDTLKDNTYRITKIGSDLSISVKTKSS